MTDWSQPSLSDTYANFLSYVTARDTSLALGLDPATTTVTNPPTNAIRWNSATSRWQKWNGTAWGNLTTAYQIDITGGSGTTLTNPVINGFTGNTAVINIGSGQIYKDASGNVAIGTASTGGKFLVYDSANGPVYTTLQNANTGSSATSLLRMDSGGRYVDRQVQYSTVSLYEQGTNITVRYSNFDTHIWRSNASSELMRLTSTGLLGIGTSTPASEGALAKLSIVGTAAQTAATLAESSTKALVVFRPNSSSGYALNFGTMTSGDMPYLQAAVFGGGAASAGMVINPFGGNVGIGGSPTYQFDQQVTTNGDQILRIYNLSTGGSAQNTFQQNVGGRFVNRVIYYPGQYMIESGSSITSRYSDFDAHIFRATAGTEFARLNSTGLGIGGTPSYKLDVTGVIRSTSDMTTNGTMMVNPTGYLLYLRNIAGTNRIDSYNHPITLTMPLALNASYMAFNIADVETMRLTATGLAIGAGSAANKLSVAGGVTISAGAVGSGAGLHCYYDTGVDAAAIFALHNAVAWKPMYLSGSVIYFQIGGVAKATLKATGAFAVSTVGVEFPDGATQAASAVWEGEIYGLTLSTAGSSTTFTVAAGAASSSTSGGGRIALAASLAKTTSAWAVGAAAGSLDTGAIANSTWYHAYVIRRPDTGVTDVLISLSATSPTLPTNYTQYRRIGSMQTNGSGQWTSFLQVGDRFYRASSTDVSTGATGYTLVTLSVPSGIVVRPFGTAQVACYGSSGGTHIYLAPASTTTLGNMLVGQVDGSAGSAYIGSYYEGPPTNTSRQVYWAANGVTIYAMLIVSGWIDERGRIS